MATYRGTTQIVAAVKGALAQTPQFKFIERKMQADRLQRYRRESLAEQAADDAAFHGRIRERIDRYAREGVVKTYAQIKEEVVTEMTLPPSRSIRPGQQSPAMVARVRERIEHYSKIGVHKNYHEIVDEVAASMR